VDSGRRHFDTNVSYHHHVFDERTGELSDIDEGDLQISGLPEVPDGMEIRRVDVVVRVGFADGR
jgi:Fur family iron response transcriptional regulator